MIKFVQQIKESTQLKWNRVNKFKPTIRLEIEMGNYTIKTADAVDELLAIFRLRYDVFYREMREIAKMGLDIDKFDKKFDHLIIIHKPTQQIIGTYRLRTSEFAIASYTAQEFDLSLMGHHGPYLELGRACIHQDFRKGSVISLLFRGIAEYMSLSGAKTLFGCSSIKTTVAEEAALIYQHLLEGGHVIQGTVVPTKAFRMPGFDQCRQNLMPALSPEQKEKAEQLVPSLIRSYIKMGAKIAGPPALDRDFECIDLLTILEKENLADILARRFQIS